MGIRRIWKVALLSLPVLLTGCEMAEEEEWVPREAAAISIDEEGAVTEYLSEVLEEAYYSFDELSQMLHSEVEEYNARYGEGSVAVSEEGQEGRTVRLVITYASGEDYARFNNVEFYYGSMINAQLAGYLFDVSYKEVRDGVVSGGEVSGSEVLKRMADQVVVARAPLEVHVPGTVTYTSSNASVLSPDVVVASGDEEGQGAVPSGQEAAGEERDARDRVYIVFDDH